MKCAGEALVCIGEPITNVKESTVWSTDWTRRIQAAEPLLIPAHHTSMSL